MNAADAAAAAAAAAAVLTGFCGENTAHFKQALPNTHTHTTHTAGLTKGLAAGEWLDERAGRGRVASSGNVLVVGSPH